MAPSTTAEADHAENVSSDMQQTKPTQQNQSWVSRLGNSMRDLPEWKYRGKLLRGKTLNTSIAIVANLAFTMFGYDQGVFSGLLTLDDFQRGYPRMAPLEQANDLCWLNSPENTIRNPGQCLGDPTLQAWGVASYQVGCFLALPLIFTWGERWGRRSSTFWGCLIMILGTIMQVVGDLAPDPYGILVAGRIIGGIGNGMVTSTIPTWQSECARPEKRGKYITISGAMISGGIAIAYWINYGFFFLTGSVRWRFPLMFQSAITMVVMIGIFYLPEPPRWLMSRGLTERAREVQARLLDLPKDHPDVEQEIHDINKALEQEDPDSFKMRELLIGGAKQNFRRMLVACASQFFQQICGINLITYYATFVFENSLGFGQQMSRLLAAANGSEYFLASVVAIPLIDRVGRRPLMLFGAAGMCLSMAMLAGSTSTGATLPNGAPQLSIEWGIVATVFLFVFNTFFAIGWLGMSWLYPAEITNSRTRIQVNALSTSSNWISNFLIVMITPPAFANLGYQTYIIFAVFCAAIFPCVYFYFPETKNRKLEEMNVIFAAANAEGISPVKKAAKMPRLEGAELDEAVSRYLGGNDVEKGELRQRYSGSSESVGT